MKNIEELFVPMHISQTLKTKLFNEPCFYLWLKNGSLNFSNIMDLRRNWMTLGSEIRLDPKGNPIESYRINGRCTAPTHQQVTSWFEDKGIFVYAFRIADKWEWNVELGSTLMSSSQGVDRIEDYKDANIALNSAIVAALKLI